MAKARDYAAEYRRRIANAQARGASRSQARGHPRRGEPHLSDVRRAQARGLKRGARPRVQPTRPDPRAVSRLVEGEATEADIRSLDAWRQSRGARQWTDLEGPLPFSLDVAAVLGTLDVRPTSIERVEVTAHPTNPDLYRVRFWVRGGNPRDRDVPADPETIAELRRAFSGPDQETEIDVDTDSTARPQPADGPLLDDEAAEAAWEGSYVPDVA